MALCVFRDGHMHDWVVRQEAVGDIFLFCPGPSLSDTVAATRYMPENRFHSLAVTTAYPLVRPTFWLGIDTPDCYDRRLWYEPFYKIIRMGYESIEHEGNRLCDYPMVAAAICRPAQTIEDEIDMILHGATKPYPWHRNSLSLAIAVAIGMGYKRLHFVGCDMGGDRDYYDGRTLQDHQRAENRALYRQQTDYIAMLANRLAGYGISFVSCTPESPLNKFLPYLSLEQAIIKSLLLYRWQDGGTPVDVRASLVPSPYATHLPVLHAIAKAIPLGRVLEFGGGIYSTPFLLSFAKEVLTVEPVTKGWLSLLKSIYADIKRWKYCSYPPDEFFDLVLVDGPDQESADNPYMLRSTQLEWAITHSPIVVLHDSNEDKAPDIAASPWSSRFLIYEYNKAIPSTRVYVDKKLEEIAAVLERIGAVKR